VRGWSGRRRRNTREYRNSSSKELRQTTQEEPLRQGRDPDPAGEEGHSHTSGRQRGCCGNVLSQPARNPDTCCGDRKGSCSCLSPMKPPKCRATGTFGFWALWGPAATRTRSWESFHDAGAGHWRRSLHCRYTG
jgi:hypothetical protein